MAAPIQVRRLVRTQASVREVQFPLPPAMPQEMLDRFPELEQWNEDLLVWAQRLQGLFEVKNPEQDVS